MDVCERREIIRIARKGAFRVDETIVAEASFVLILNGIETTRFFCTPCFLEPLAIGWLLSNQVIGGMKDIEKLSVNTDEGTICVKKGDGSSAFHCKAEEPSPFFTISNEQIEQIFQIFNVSSDLFNSTGGVHSCAVLPKELIEGFNGGFPVFMEDISRRNAVLKAVGSMLMKDMSSWNSILLFSGRLALEIVDTAARLGFQIILAAGAPSLAAIEVADNNGVTLAGFIKPDKINVYTHPQRIASERVNDSYA